MGNKFIDDWISKHQHFRKIDVRVSDRISSPLTYGTIFPIILLPKKIDLEDETELDFILSHEYVHIRNFDSVKKLLLLITAILHWFNPLVWIMYILAARDIELCCDECVMRQFGVKNRAAYSMMLLKLEEKRSVVTPFCTHLSKNAIEERIESIMKFKKESALALALAIMLVGRTIGIFATEALAASNEADVSLSDVFAPIDMVMQASDNQATTNSTSTGFSTIDKTMTTTSDEAGVDVSDDLADAPVLMKTVSLSPGTAYKYDKMYLEEGTQIDIYASWSPTSVDLKLGVYSVSTGSAYTATIDDGSGGVAVTINESGYYYIYVANTSSSKSADISISYAY